MARPWTIGIDVRGAAEIPAGRGRVVRELLIALAARDDDLRYVLYCRRPPNAIELDDRFDWRTRLVAEPAWPLWAAASAGGQCDVFLSINSYLTASLMRVSTAIIVHDLIPFTPGIPSHRRSRRIERLTLGPAVHRADAIVCVSRSTRDDLLGRYPRAHSKTTVVPLGVGPPFTCPKSPRELARVRKLYDLPASFVLAVGTLEPRKNLSRLVEAHAGLPAGLRAGNPLILVGPEGWDRDVELRRATSRGGDVRTVGHVPDDDLSALYASCTVFCYPSLYEGFGLPVLEAMRSGAPTITSNVASLPEVAGDGAWYVNPISTPEIRSALAELLSSPGKRAELGRRATARAASFSWGRTAEQILAVLARRATEPRASP